jgi:hypothetical protein
MKERTTLLLLYFLIITDDALAQKATVDKRMLEKGFKNPPVVARSKTLWLWVNGNLACHKLPIRWSRSNINAWAVSIFEI